MEQSIVIAGNGHSYVNINYKCLPKDFHTMRVNNFYFEDKYYLGKNVTYYLCRNYLLKNQYFNIVHLQNNNEYITSNVFPMLNIDDTSIIPALSNFIITDKFFELLKQHSPLIYNYLVYYNNYHREYITLGLIGVLLAICLGYKTIYITGIDFYPDVKKPYPFQIGTQFVSIRKKHFDNYTDEIPMTTEFHTAQIEESVIILIKKHHPDVELLSISEETDMNTLIPMAPEINNTPYKPIVKPKDALKDWLLLPEYENNSNLSKKQKLKSFFIKKGLKDEYDTLVNNKFLRFLFKIYKFIRSCAYTVLILPKISVKIIQKIFYK